MGGVLTHLTLSCPPAVGPPPPQSLGHLKELEEVMELASRKNERFALYERKLMIPKFRVQGQPVTSEVRTNSQSWFWKRNSFGRYQVDQND